MVVLEMLYVFSTVFNALILRVSDVIADSFPLRAFNETQHGWNSWNSALDELTHLRRDLAEKNRLFSH